MMNLVDTGQCFRTPEPSWFDTETDWDAVRAELSKFPELHEPIRCAPGMQILKQPFVECVISFIVSTNNNIKRFTKTLAQMQLNLDWLCAQTEEDFRRIGCGYRALYLVKAAGQLRDLDFNVLNKMDDDALYKELRKITGAGDKVVRCVMLFCFHRLHIVPVDTWIVKAYEAILGSGDGLTPAKMAEQLQARWGRYAGVAQQYVFYYTQYLRKEL